jgi:hypothetical protein
MVALVRRWLSGRVTCESCGNAVSVIRLELGNNPQHMPNAPDREAFLICWQCMPETIAVKHEHDGKTITKLHLA